MWSSPWLKDWYIYNTDAQWRQVGEGEAYLFIIGIIPLAVTWSQHDDIMPDDQTRDMKHHL